MITVSDIGRAFSTWANQEQFTYRGHSLEMGRAYEP